MLKVKPILKPLIIINFFLFLLVGCGGGGGSSNSRSDTFPVKQAFRDLNKDGSTSNFTVTGTINGVSVTGSGSYISSAAVAGTFEGSSAFVVSNTLSGSITGNGNTLQLNYSSSSYFDTNYNPIGFEDDESYSTSTIEEWPVTVKAGDSGDLGIQTNYTDDSKSIMTGTIESSYAVTAGSLGSVTIKITKLEYNDIHVEVGSEIETYSLSSTGELKHISTHAVSTDSDLVYEVD